jgi:two-component system chemotaxis sensor kinase CheA
MKMRMVPVGKLYQKAPRIVRDLSKEFTKKINLVVKGEETEIDRGIIEELTDPLTHMIRNSCDHGIETPDKRIAKGKSETGTITLDAEQEGNNIVLKISDDGAGMDAELLKAKAIEKSILTVEQAATMPNKEAYQLIFAPGFSTAAKVTSVSGRGVGMDVVRTNIAELKGFIEIETEVGKGTTFYIKLPLTLAIIQGLIVHCGGEKFAIPLNSVLNVVSVETDSIYTLNQVEVIRIREDVIPLLRLDYALDTPEKKNDISGSYVVIVGIGSQSIGIIVDDLLGQQEVVIKSLGEYLGSIKAISGSTIMGDGSVIMIVDVAQLVEGVYEAKAQDFQQVKEELTKK